MTTIRPASRTSQVQAARDLQGSLEVHGGLDLRDTAVREAEAHSVDARVLLAGVVLPAVRPGAVGRSCDLLNLLLGHATLDRKDTALFRGSASNQHDHEGNRAGDRCEVNAFHRIVIRRRVWRASHAMAWAVVRLGQLWDFTVDRREPSTRAEDLDAFGAVEDRVVDESPIDLD